LFISARISLENVAGRLLTSGAVPWYNDVITGTGGAMANGRQVSVYVDKVAEKEVRRHMERTGRSYSAAFCDLAVRGAKAASVREDLGLLKDTGK